MRARVLIALAGALLAIPVVPAAAQSPATAKVFQDFAADGRIDPCKHTSEALRAVQKNIPPDIEQYAPDYPAAVDAALEARARGECLSKQAPKPATAVPAAPTASPTPAATTAAPDPPQTFVPDPPAPETAPVSAAPSANAAADVALERAATARAANDAPVPVLLLAIVALLLALFAAFLFAAHRMGIAERPRHAWREAAWRTTGLWENFKDWMRLGR